MRIIQVKLEGKWTYTKTVDDDQANRIVRALNKEGHTARSIKVKRGARLRAEAEYNTAKLIRTDDKPVITQAVPGVTLLDLNDIVPGPTVDEIAQAVRNVVKANRPKIKTDSEFTAAQLAAMLRIEGAGRMEDPARCGLKIHAATLRALVLRGVVLIGLNDSLHLSVPGRRALLAAIAKIVAPNAERKS